MRGIENFKLIKVKAASVAGTSAIESDVIDLQDYEGVVFFTTAGAITSGGVQSIKVECGDVANLSDAADVAGLTINIADDDDDQTFALDYRKATKRYCRASVSRATQNSAFGEIYAICYGPHIAAVNNNVTDTVTIDK